MANTRDNGDTGCFDRLLCHLLCRHGAPTHPSDTMGDPNAYPVGPCGRIPQEGSKLEGGRDELGSTLSSGRRAGVVARLMGLETLPDTKWVPCSKSPDVFSRSRSVNFMDYLLEMDLSSRRVRRHRHRRAKTSASFREVPVPVPMLHPQPTEKDFVVVILADKDEREIERRPTPRRHEANRKKKSDCCSKEKKVLKLRDEPLTRSRVACNHKLGQSNTSARKSQRKDTWKQVVVPAADNADSSSPVSVLDKPERYCLQRHNLRKSASASPSHKAGRDKSTSMRVARILDPEQKVAGNMVEVEFPDSTKHVDNTVWKAHMLAGEEAGRLGWQLPVLASHEEVCRMIEQDAFDCLLEEVVRTSS